MNELYDLGKSTVEEFKWRFRALTKTFRSRIETSVDSPGLYLVTSGEAPSVIQLSHRVESHGLAIFYVPVGNYWIYKSPQQFATDLDAHKAFYTDPLSFELIVANRSASRRG